MGGRRDAIDGAGIDCSPGVPSTILDATEISQIRVMARACARHIPAARLARRESVTWRPREVEQPWDLRDAGARRAHGRSRGERAGAAPRSGRRRCRTASRRSGRRSPRDRTSIDACAVVGREPGPRRAVARGGTRRAARHLRSAVTGDDPAYDDVAGAVAGAGARRRSGYLHQLSCEDPLTGLASLAHLRSRLSELYRGGGAGDGRRHRAATRSSSLELPSGGGPSDEPGDQLHPRAARWPGSARPPARSFAGDETIGRLGIAPGRGPGPARRPARTAGRRCCARCSTDSTPHGHGPGLDRGAARHRRRRRACCSTSSARG